MSHDPWAEPRPRAITWDEYVGLLTEIVEDLKAERTTIATTESRLAELHTHPLVGKVKSAGR